MWAAAATQRADFAVPGPADPDLIGVGIAMRRPPRQAELGDCDTVSVRCRTDPLRALHLLSPLGVAETLQAGKLNGGKRGALTLS